MVKVVMKIERTKRAKALVIAKAKAIPDDLPVLVAELLTTFHKEETDKGQDP